MIFWRIGLIYQLMVLGLKVVGLLAWPWWAVFLPIEIIAVVALVFVVGILLGGAVGRNPFQ